MTTTRTPDTAGTPAPEAVGTPDAVGTPAPDVPMIRIPRSAHPEPTEPRLRSSRVPLVAFGALVLVLLAGLLVGARSLGWFTTTGRGAALPARTAAAPAASAAPTTGTGQGATGAIGATGAAGATGRTGPTGQGGGDPSEEKVAPTAGASPDDVKGWMTVQQVLDAFPVTREALYARFGIPADTDPSTTLSGIKESGAESFDIPALRTWLGEQTG